MIPSYDVSYEDITVTVRGKRVTPSFVVFTTNGYILDVAPGDSLVPEFVYLKRAHLDHEMCLALDLLSSTALDQRGSERAESQFNLGECACGTNHEVMS